MQNKQTYIEGKGQVYCHQKFKSFRCPRHPYGFKFPGKKKCMVPYPCSQARFYKEASDEK